MYDTCWKLHINWFFPEGLDAAESLGKFHRLHVLAEIFCQGRHEVTIVGCRFVSVFDGAKVRMQHFSVKEFYAL